MQGDVQGALWRHVAHALLLAAPHLVEGRERTRREGRTACDPRDGRERDPGDARRPAAADPGCSTSMLRFE